MFYLDILIYILYTKELSMSSHFFWFLWGENVPLFCLVFFDFGREFYLACLICICKLHDWSIVENEYFIFKSEWALIVSALVFVVIWEPLGDLAWGRCLDPHPRASNKGNRRKQQVNSLGETVCVRSETGRHDTCWWDSNSEDLKETAE